MSNLFSYQNTCKICGINKPQCEFLKRLGKYTSVCLECTRIKLRKKYKKKLPNRFAHPWVKDVNQRVKLFKKYKAESVKFFGELKDKHDG